MFSSYGIDTNPQRKTKERRRPHRSQATVTSVDTSVVSNTTGSVSTTEAHRSHEFFGRPLRAPGFLEPPPDPIAPKPIPVNIAAGDRNKHRPVVSVKALERCREDLLQAFGVCKNGGRTEDMGDLTCTISCCSSSSRPLHISELQDAVAMHAYAQWSQSHWNDHTTADFRTWLAKFGALLAVNGAGYVAFGVAEMPYFLRSFRIRGVDASHRTIAMICLAFVELAQDSPPTPFSNYAASNWRFHESIAARYSISLRYHGARNDRPDRRRIAASPRRSPTRSLRRRSRSPMDTMQTGFQRLDIEDEVEGWVSVEKSEGSP